MTWTVPRGAANEVADRQAVRSAEQTEAMRLLRTFDHAELAGRHPVLAAMLDLPRAVAEPPGRPPGRRTYFTFTMIGTLYAGVAPSSRNSCGGT